MHKVINLTFYVFIFGSYVEADMHKYAHMAWDRNLNYFCNNWRKREFTYLKEAPHRNMSNVKYRPMPAVEFFLTLLEMARLL